MIFTPLEGSSGPYLIDSKICLKFLTLFVEIKGEKSNILMMPYVVVLIMMIGYFAENCKIMFIEDRARGSFG